MAAELDPNHIVADELRELSSVKGRVAIVTGAAQGIGRVFAHAYAAHGAIPVVADLNFEKAQSVAADIRATGAQALAIKVDAASAESLDAMAKTAFDAFGRIDILVNNAGIFSTLAMRPFQEIPDEEWRKVIDVNVTGVMLASRAVLPYMKKANWGRIINMSSGSMFLGRPNYLHYVTSKSALVGMSRSMARELGSWNITVNAMMPGAVMTEIPRATVTPEQRQRIVSSQCVTRSQVPVDLVGPLLFLSAEGSRFYTGQSLNCDGGSTHL